MIERLFNAAWYGSNKWTWLLWPLSMLVLFITQRKRQRYLESNKEPNQVPVIVVGNITVGGTGKTPVVQALVRHLEGLGYQPGIVSRGYGGKISIHPHLVESQDLSDDVGDEPYMLFTSLKVPVVVDPDRKRGATALLQAGVDVIISDDGMQHYNLHRDYEVCVIDGSRGLGNEQLLPVGPLREHKSRLASVDYVLNYLSDISDHNFQVQPVAWVNVKSGIKVALDELPIEKHAMAIAGIGNPQKFLNTLNALGVQVPHKWFSDHYAYTEQDLSSLPRQLLMTEKDAVKIQPFATEQMWFLEICALLPHAFLNDISLKLKEWELKHG